MNHAKRKFKPFKKIWERETHGCLQSIGLWNVSAYLQVDSSVIELIIALGSEHTNLTCKSTFKKKRGGWFRDMWKMGMKYNRTSNTSYLSFSRLICKITYGSVCKLMSMIPTWITQWESGKLESLCQTTTHTETRPYMMRIDDKGNPPNPTLYLFLF